MTTHNNNELQKMLMQQVYGPDLDQAKSNSEVLHVLKSMSQGPARDQALNLGMNSRDFKQLMDFEIAQHQAVIAHLQAPVLAARAREHNASAAVSANASASASMVAQEQAPLLRLIGTSAYLASAVLAADESGDALSYIDEQGRRYAESGDLGQGLVLVEKKGHTAAVSSKNKSALEVDADVAAVDAAAWDGETVETDGTDGTDGAEGTDALSEGNAGTQESPRLILMVRGQRFSLAPEVWQYISEHSKKHETLDVIAQAVKERFRVEISTSRLRNMLRFGLAEVKAFKERTLRPCYPVIYVIVKNISMMTQTTLVVEHPFYIIMGMNFDGSHDLLDIAPLPKDYESEGSCAQMWERTFADLKSRGLADLVYVVTGEVSEFQEALHSVYPLAIYQHSLRDILRQASEPMSTADRSDFTNDCRELHSSKSLLECMRALMVVESKWNEAYPSALAKIHENFIFYEQYYAAHRTVRSSIYTTKTLDLLLKQLHRDIHNDSSHFLYGDALHVIARILELDLFVTGTRHPVQWKRALCYMLNDQYVGKILSKYISLDDVKLSPRSIKRDQALEQAQAQAQP